jgi:hypothetical protein
MAHCTSPQGYLCSIELGLRAFIYSSLYLRLPEVVTLSFLLRLQFVCLLWATRTALCGCPCPNTFSDQIKPLSWLAIALIRLVLTLPNTVNTVLKSIYKLVRPCCSVLVGSFLRIAVYLAEVVLLA